jgi:hypothetical protein
LLRHYLQSQVPTDACLVVYRGLSLTHEQRRSFMRPTMTFTSFTSTSKKREKAEQFGDTLIIFDLDRRFNDERLGPRTRCGMDISHISDFPDEEEFLIWSNTRFEFVKQEYDESKMKHIIYLRGSMYNK